jgi:hypothetical protein
MTDLNDFIYTDGVHDVLALYVNKLVAGNLRGELTNVETMAADKTLTDADFPSQFLNPNGSNRVVKLPTKAAINHLFFVAHTGSANTVTVKNSDASVTLGVLAAGEVMLAVSGGATKEYAGIKTATDLSVYLLRSGLSEWDEQGSDPTTPAANKWKLFFKAGGLYLVDDAGVVTGPLGVPIAPTPSVVVQAKHYQMGAVATTTTLIPADDTIPQNTEGSEFLSLAITPTSATNKLLIEATLNVANSAAGFLSGALFQDSTVSALAAGLSFQPVNEMRQIAIRHEMVAGTTSATTFKVRGGGSAAGTTTLNGLAGGRIFGGVCISSLRITEIKV